MAGNKQIPITFGVAGGGSINGESGKQILSDLKSIVSQIEAKGATSLKFSIDTKDVAGSTAAQQSEFNKLKKAATEYYGLRRQFESTDSSSTQKRLTIEKQIVESNKRLNALSNSLTLSKKQQLEYDNLIRQQTEKIAVVQSGNTDKNNAAATTKNVKNQSDAYKELLNLQSNRNSIATKLASTDVSNQQERVGLIQQMKMAQGEYNNALSKTGAFTKQSILSAEQEDSLLKSQVEHRQQIVTLQGKIADTSNATVTKNQVASVDDSFAKTTRTVGLVSTDDADLSQLTPAYEKLIYLKNEFEKAPTKGNLDAYRAQATAVKTYTDELNAATQATKKKTAEDNNSLTASTHVQNKLEEARGTYEKYSSAIQKNTTLNQKWQDFLNKSASGGYKNDWRKMENDLAGLNRETREASANTQTFAAKIKGLFSQHFATATALVGVHLIQQALRQMYQNVLELDTALTQFKIVTQDTDAEIKKFGNDAANVAKQIGSSISDVVNAATVFARLGYNTQESLDLSKYTTIYSKVAAVDMSAAESNITAMAKAFDISTDQLESALDKMTYVGNNFPISASELGEGLQNAASALAVAGNSFSQSLAILTAANTVVQDISKSSTAVRTITARIRNSGTELEDLGETLEDDYNTVAKYREKLLAISGTDILEADQKTFKSTYDILDELQSKWKDLSDIDKASITNMLAGTRQTNVFASLMSEWGEAESVMSSMGESTGALQKAQETYIDSIQGRLSQFKAVFQDLSATVVNSSLVKGGLQLGTGLLSLLNTLIGAGDGAIIKIGLIVGALALLTKAQSALNGVNLLSAGRHKMICLVNMLANNLVVTRNELVA